MANYIGLLFSVSIIIFSVLMDIFVGYALIVCWLLFVIISLKKGYDFKSIYKMSYEGGKKSYLVGKILLLIGAVIGAWMISGTIPSIVYYALKLIHPDTFVLFTFLICCALSFVLGSATGTATVIGLPLIIIARSGDVGLDLVAGAIIAGVYFGDRCSPMSSSAALVSQLTRTNLIKNIKNMFTTSAIPFALSLLFYYVFSKLHPLKITSSNLTDEFTKIFTIDYLVLLPVILLLVLCLCRLGIQYAMIISIIVASVIAVTIQEEQPFHVLQTIFFGFSLEEQSPLLTILHGGGVVSMLKASLVIFAACALAGVLEGISVFSGIKHLLLNMKLKRHTRYGLTTFISTMNAAFGCSQAIAVVMSDEIMRDCYKKEENYQFSISRAN